MPNVNISLRPFEVADEDSIVDLLLDEQVKKTYMIPDFPSRQAAKPLFERMAQLSRDEKRFVRAICLDDKAIGMLNDVDMDRLEVEVGYALLPAHWGRGYATQALQQAMEALFARGVETVKAAAFQCNPASARVMEKAGMVKTERTEEVEYRGVTHRCICYEKKKN